MSLPAIIILFIILTLLSFFFSSSETSIIGLSKIRLRHMLSRGVKGAQSIQRLMSNLDKFIVAILVGNNFVNIAMSSIATGICVLIFGYKWGILIASLSTAFFVLIFCEITPKILAIKHTERFALFVAPIMELFIKIFNPVISLFTGASDLLLKLLRIKPGKRSPLITEEELRLMIELGKEEGFLSVEEGKMLQRIFEFGDTKVKDVMVPKDKIIAVDINTTSEALLNIFVEEGHARLPVYKGTPDNIVGIVYAHDLLYILKDKGLFLLQDLLHEVYYISLETPVHEVLKKFQADKVQIAIVADKHNKTQGLVTLEDLTEEIVGEVEEKHIRHNTHK
jgi:CBS domain containing-hemolysin-like protein